MGNARRKNDPRHGEDLLGSIEKFTVRLENGREVEFVVREELRIDDDPEQWERELRCGSERLFFWEYQTERALFRVRQLELKVSRTEGAMDPAYRRQFELHEAGGEYREAMVRAAIQNDREVIGAKRKLIILRKQYGYIRAMANAVRNRCFVLDRLMSKAQKEFASDGA